MNINMLLVELNIKHEIKTFILSDQTRQENDVLYYKNIPSALLFLNHLQQFNTPVLDDGLEVKGTMIDLSRNAVFKVDYFKTVIKKQAFLGFNEIWLYLEDVYDLNDYPKFGYLRGKYKKEELKELVSYAKHFGVALVPCIQTLGHMSQFLRWPSSDKYRDQRDVLLLGEDTNHLIDAMLSFCREVFETDKIHVGLDETFGFSFGAHYKLHGHKSPEDLFLNHVNVVYQKAKAHGFVEVCMWSDMFFRHRSKTNYYYDYNISFEDEFINKIPSDMTLVYWDYYNKSELVFDEMIKKHQELKRKVIMASGTWIWTRLTYDRIKTLDTATHAISASIKNNVKEIVFTQWNDDGAYCYYESNFLGLSDVTKILTKDSFNEEYLDINHILNSKTFGAFSNVTHQGFDPVMLLWDDMLLGIYLNDLVGYDYEKLALIIDQFKSYINQTDTTNDPYFESLFNVLLKKLEVRYLLLKGYFKDKNLNGIEPVVKAYKEVMMNFLELFELHWKSSFKVFGLEVIQHRLFSQLRRADELLTIAKTFKKHDQIPYLEEKITKEPYLSVKHADIAFSSKP